MLCHGRAPAKTLQQPAAVVICCRVARLKLYGCAIPCQRLLGATELVRGPRAVVHRSAVIRAESYGTVVVLNRRLVLPLHVPQRLLQLISGEQLYTVTSADTC